MRGQYPHQQKQLLHKSSWKGKRPQEFCCLVITFANSLEPDQDPQVGPDMDPNCLTL